MLADGSNNFGWETAMTTGTPDDKGGSLRTVLEGAAFRADPHAVLRQLTDSEPPTAANRTVRHRSC